jgi:protein-S-isoprenylcysteine O-methyltransferase Ste14
MCIPISTIVEYIGVLEILVFLLVFFGLMLPGCQAPVKVTVQSVFSLKIGAALLILLVMSICINVFGSHSLFFWTKFSSPVTAQIAGEALLLPSLFVMGWSQYTLGKQWTAAIQILEGHELITTGPYRFVRHPFLLSILMVSFAIFLHTGWWLSFLSFLLNFVYSCYLIPLEEQALMAEFGMDYLDYRWNTGSFIPRSITDHISMLFCKDSIEISHHFEESLLIEPTESETISKYGSLPI